METADSLTPPQGDPAPPLTPIDPISNPTSTQTAPREDTPNPTPHPLPLPSLPLDMSTSPEPEPTELPTPEDNSHTPAQPPSLTTPKQVPPSIPSHSTPTPVPTGLQAHLAVATENKRRTNNSLASMRPGTFPIHTPRPINGFPLTHLVHTSQLLDHMDPTCIRAWDEDVPSPKLLVRVYDLNADTSTPERIQTIITAMKNVIMGIEYDLPQINPPAVKIALPTRAPDAKAAPLLLPDI
jgi:hypothetical protein